MTTYYLDASALSKRYVQESGTTWVRDLLVPGTSNTLLGARVTMVEIYSALARRRREGTVPLDACDTAIQALTAHGNTDYEFVELDTRVVAQAGILLEHYPLRAYDAVQLASALVVQQVLQSAQLPALVFVSADNRLNQVAMDEGLAVVNPNAYP